MKKKINKKICFCIGFVFLVLLSLLLIFGKHTTVCTLKSDQSINEYVLNTTYTITYQKGIVKKVKIREVVQGDSDTVLNRFETEWKDNYEYLNKSFGGYTYKITKKNKKIISDVVVDYDKLNLKKFFRINEAMKEFSNEKGQITIKGIKSMYEQSGAVCK